MRFRRDGINQPNSIAGDVAQPFPVTEPYANSISNPSPNAVPERLAESVAPDELAPRLCHRHGLRIY